MVSRNRDALHKLDAQVSVLSGLLLLHCTSEDGIAMADTRSLI